HVDLLFDRAARTVTLTVKGPGGEGPKTIEEIHAAGDGWWPLAMARELDDAILMLRINELDLGLVLVKSSGDPQVVLGTDTILLANREDWLVRETIGMLRRTFARFDVSSRSFYTIIEPGSCFAGLLYELALASDRSYMLAMPEGEGESPRVSVDEFNFGLLPAVSGRSRLENRFIGAPERFQELQKQWCRLFDPSQALELGLISVAPDDLDWEDELRMAIEERASLSPD